MDMTLREPRPSAPARQWLVVAVSTLVLAGGLALALVFGRVPGLDRLVDGPDFFRRCLVVHVDLALVAWLPAFAATLWCLMPGARAADRRATTGAAIAALGLVLLVTSALLPGSRPVLSNYVPAIDHPLFAVAIGTFFLGVLVAFGDSARGASARALRPAAWSGPRSRRPASRRWCSAPSSRSSGSSR